MPNRGNSIEKYDWFEGAFLDFLEEQIVKGRRTPIPITRGFRDRMKKFSAGIVVDLSEEITGPVSLDHQGTAEPIAVP